MRKKIVILSFILCLSFIPASASWLDGQDCSWGSLENMCKKIENLEKSQRIILRNQAIIMAGLEIIIRVKINSKFNMVEMMDAVDGKTKETK